MYLKDFVSLFLLDLTIFYFFIFFYFFPYFLSLAFSLKFFGNHTYIVSWLGV